MLTRVTATQTALTYNQNVVSRQSSAEVFVLNLVRVLISFPSCALQSMYICGNE